jgi:hypothetical protein
MSLRLLTYQKMNALDSYNNMILLELILRDVYHIQQKCLSLIFDYSMQYIANNTIYQKLFKISKTHMIGEIAFKVILLLPRWTFVNWKIKTEFVWGTKYF